MSESEISDTTDVAFSSSMALLPKVGSISGSACGRITWRIRWKRVRLTAMQASNWSRGTARIAPRTTSAP